MSGDPLLQFTAAVRCIPAVVLEPTREEALSPNVDYDLIGASYVVVPEEGPAVAVIMRAREGITYGAVLSRSLAEELAVMLDEAIRQVPA